VHFEKLQRGEIIACVGGLLLAIAVFLPWYSTDSGNPNSKIDGRHGDFSAWDAHTISRFLFLLAAAAPFILAWIVVREHQLSWPRGELTAIAGITSGVLVLVLGFIARPGEPRDTISFQIGWYLALVASVVILVGAVQRTAETETVRKPPGVL
jgi:uncharacterized membrane protein